MKEILIEKISSCSQANIPIIEVPDFGKFAVIMLDGIQFVLSGEMVSLYYEKIYPRSLNTVLNSAAKFRRDFLDILTDRRLDMSDIECEYSAIDFFNNLINKEYTYFDTFNQYIADKCDVILRCVIEMYCLYFTQMDAEKLRIFKDALGKPIKSYACLEKTVSYSVDVIGEED